jgi:predicted 2-oxoglutarate/Fe(II)-dependent dioxygenase YbiX
MTSINSKSKLEDLIGIEKNVIPKELCNYIIGLIENEKWESHGWLDPQEGVYFQNKSKEPSVCNSSEIIQNILNPYILKAKDNYISKISYEPSSKIVTRFCHVRFNRYDAGQLMREHHDHINSLFTPPERGIPVLSMILGLNDDYEGGDLIFWNEIKFKISTGDIIIWPSLFLYPHQVSEITKNKRYTGVCWFW